MKDYIENLGIWITPFVEMNFSKLIKLFDGHVLKWPKVRWHSVIGIYTLQGMNCYLFFFNKKGKNLNFLEFLQPITTSPSTFVCCCLLCVCVCVLSLNVTYLLESCFIQSITLPPPPISCTTCFLALPTQAPGKARRRLLCFRFIIRV